MRCSRVVDPAVSWPGDFNSVLGIYTPLLLFSSLLFSLLHSVIQSIFLIVGDKLLI